MDIKKRLKKDIVRNIKRYIDKELFNHRKHKLGLVSLHNQLLNRLMDVLNDWERYDKIYIPYNIRDIPKPTKHNYRKKQGSHN